ncbi:hypothetical protein E2C01_033750 [Portunus trituberculatus]|uniref:Uncharacterized protein n=1 Tax=Portunus trituberculatus TaxID=210409 RepID=A0A5B7F6I1_PORTR|nr:hypothetical protein [Portunus trituberculatus]
MARLLRGETRRGGVRHCEAGVMGRLGSELFVGGRGGVLEPRACGALRAWEAQQLLHLSHE